MRAAAQLPGRMAAEAHAQASPKSSSTSRAPLARARPRVYAPCLWLPLPSHCLPVRVRAPPLPLLLCTGHTQRPPSYCSWPCPLPPSLIACRLPPPPRVLAHRRPTVRVHVPCVLCRLLSPFLGRVPLACAGRPAHTPPSRPHRAHWHRHAPSVRRPPHTAVVSVQTEHVTRDVRLPVHNERGSFVGLRSGRERKVLQTASPALAPCQ